MITARVTVTIPGNAAGDCVLVDDTNASVQRLIAVGWLIPGACTIGAPVTSLAGMRLADLADVAGTIAPGVAPVEDGTGYFRLVDVATQAELDALAALVGTGGAFTLAVVQAGHGLLVTQQIRCTGVNTWVVSKADAAGNADADGVVTAVADSSHFTVQLAGPLLSGYVGLTAGQDYFEDPVTGGAVTATEPSTPGQVSVPVLKAISATQVIFKPQRGLVIPPKTRITIPIILLADATSLPGILEDAFGYTYIVPSYLNGYTLVAGAPSGSIPTTTWVIKTAAGTTIPQLALRKGAATEMLATPLSIDVGELTSDTAATAAVAAGGGAATVATGDPIHFDIDATDAAAKGSTIHLTFVAP